jgi:hypothetical protein
MTKKMTDAEWHGQLKALQALGDSGGVSNPIVFASQEELDAFLAAWENSNFWDAAMAAADGEL